MHASGMASLKDAQQHLSPFLPYLSPVAACIPVCFAEAEHCFLSILCFLYKPSAFSRGFNLLGMLFEQHPRT
jgi:hypothetical protein